MTIEVVHFREEFRDDVGRLLTAFWPDPSQGLAEFSWLVERNPYASAPMVYLALSGGRPVGMRVFHAARWEVVGTGQCFDVPCGAMFVTDEAVRGRGIGKALMEAAVDELAGRGVRHLFSFGAGPATYRIQERQGWRPVANYDEVSGKGARHRWRRSFGNRFPLLRKTIRWVRRETARGATASRADVSQVFSALDAGTPSSYQGGQLKVARTPDASAMAALSGHGGYAGLIRHVRDAEYFAWRYSAPTRQSRILTWSQGDAEGFLVIETRCDVLRPVRIVDWEVTDDEVLTRLLRAAIEFGQFRDLRLWQAGLSGKVVDFLGQSGFVEVSNQSEAKGYSPGLMVKALRDPEAIGAWDACGTSLVAPENWALRCAYLL